MREDQTDRSARQSFDRVSLLSVLKKGTGTSRSREFYREDQLLLGASPLFQWSAKSDCILSDAIVEPSLRAD